MSDPRLDTLAASMPFAVKAGLKFTEAAPNRVRAEVTVAPDCCTAGGIAHGAS
jgi:acyl-coenzyme A thioesterase PaaI-like protein